MATPRGLGSLLLLLLLLTSGQEKTTEQPRNTCLGRNNIDKYDILNLNDKASCFTTCRPSGSDSCNVENLQRYWLNFEAHLVKEGLTEKVNMTFLKALVQNLSTNTAEDLYFSLKPSQIPRQVMKDEDKPPDRVRLPKSFFRSLPGNRSEVRLAITILDIGSGTLFKGPQLGLGDGSGVLNNHLVGLSVGQMHVTKLAEPLEIVFSHQRPPPPVLLSLLDAWPCCDHLTFFALLLRPTLDQSTVHILTRISQAGCGVSMIFLAFTIILYAVLRLSRQRFKSEDAPKIHVALGGSLFLLNLAFLVNVGSGSKGSDAACWARGAVFHYFLLCAFTWMGLEAFHLYLLAVRVFNTYFGHYFLKLSLVGWGLPALMVIGTGSANSYGLYTIRDRENRTSLELCWFREGTAMYTLYITVHGYFLITFLFGMVVLALVAWKIFTLSGATAVKEQGQNWKKVLTILGLSSLLGVTWGLAIFTPLGLSTVYIFALFNSLQGVFICCWFTILYLPSQSTTVSSSTARLDQAHSASQE
uniref:Adhesion G protein-coupled receptor G3 n=1 Tax=Macaca fascicularis TaxID=9541 RepID=A0A2K5URH3_MACFA